ncbi:MiAMP1 family antimicrobial peptide [Nonomuraea sp. NPDC050451]|uniref:MiAMP1 family antimicrobial peptide n=1 Tax=Nonomuraea sp. NPDC050451 TaxID=3364364 RepID=UPI00378FE3DD
MKSIKRIALVSAVSASLVMIMGGAANASTSAGPGSTFVAYEGPGFTGRTQVIDKCGVTNLRYRGSYKWYGGGQSGRMHNQINARGPVHFTLPTQSNAQQKTVVGWKSIFVVC